MARPKKQITLTQEQENQIIKMYSEGASDVEVIAYLIKQFGSFSKDLFYRLLNEDEAFSSTIKKGRTLCEAWWIERGRTELKNNTFNYTGWYMQMKNRFGWKDKQEQDTNIKVAEPIVVKIVKNE